MQVQSSDHLNDLPYVQLGGLEVHSVPAESGALAARTPPRHPTGAGSAVVLPGPGVGLTLRRHRLRRHLVRSGLTDGAKHDGAGVRGLNRPDDVICPGVLEEISGRAGS